MNGPLVCIQQLACEMVETTRSILLRYVIGCFGSRSSVSGKRVCHALMSDDYHSLSSSPLWYIIPEIALNLADSRYKRVPKISAGYITCKSGTLYGVLINLFS